MMNLKMLIRGGLVNKITASLFLAVVLYSCGGSQKPPDVSGIKLSLQSQRFDRDFVKMDTNKLPESLKGLYSKYPDFLNFYLDTFMSFGVNGNYTEHNKGIDSGLRVFITQKDCRALFDTVAKHYPDTKYLDEQLTEGFQYMKYYYPNYKVPKIIYTVCGLSKFNAFTYGDNIVGISLDMFLGPQFPYYKADNIAIPEFIIRRLDAPFIPTAVFSVIYLDAHPFIPDNKILLDMMIQKGKQQYFLHKILPYTPDSILFAYTQQQVQWCEKNEAEVYNFFIKKNFLYNKSMLEIFRYLNEGPFSAGMPPESPGNIGQWLGYRIVLAYMKTHPQTTLQQLLANNMDAQKFLGESKYKPK